MNPAAEQYTRMVSALHSAWKPHAGQVRAGQSYFRDGKKSIFVQCGRKWGKTELALYFLWRMAQSNPGSPCYFIAPLQTQAKEIVWADPRIQNFGPREWLLPGSSGVNNTEMRLNLQNGSFIKIDGSDNYEKYRGPRFKICVYEEYKDHRPEFRRAMRPNASVLDGLELFIGSPPDRDCDYTILADDHRTDSAKFFYHAPSWENPHLSKKWLEDEKRQLYARGEGDVWEREYAAKFIKGGASKIFPMIGKELTRPHSELVQRVYRDRKKMEWFLWTDPAAASCFAVLYAAINPYTKEIFVLDEIYETNQGEMSVGRIGRRIFSKRDELFDDSERWRQGYDEAETWFASEVLDQFQEHFEPSHKHLNDKEVGLSLIKDALLSKRVLISDRCQKFYWELDNYYKDKTGKIPKKHDHLIDDFRYILGAAAYQLNEEREVHEEEDEDFRGQTMEQEFPDLSDIGGYDLE